MHDPGGRAIPFPEGVTASAVFGGDDEQYRYLLTMIWDSSKPTIMAIGMNSSTASHLKGDATVNKLIRSSMKWGYGQLVMTNVHAYRCKDQSRLSEVEDPIGSSNRHFIMQAAERSKLILACFGKPKIKRLQGNGFVLARDLTRQGYLLHVLKLSNDGTPCHPLYLRGDLMPVLWQVPMVAHA